MADLLTEPTSVFSANREELFETIRVSVRFTGRLAGGQPKDPKLVQGWLRKNMGIDDELELLARTRQHLGEMGIEVAEDASYDDLVAASEAIASKNETQGFKRVSDQPCIEGRHVKAGIKESVNILFAGERWGKVSGYQGKGPKGFTAERVFCKPDWIPVGDADDVKVDLSIGHITGPTGPQSTIGYYEYVEGAEAAFEVLQLRSQKKGGREEPALDYETWAKVWTHMELNGLGAMRSQGFGQFVVVAFETTD